MTKHPQQWRTRNTPADQFGRIVLAVIVAVGSWIAGVVMVLSVVLLRAFRKR